ncbi:MAG: hypothetical protein AAB217_18585 [Chloroflexota bacterium]
MELEQRVKVLEQEVKLLKSEIQATLLDIQEQLLSAHYPALRAEESSAEMPLAGPLVAGSNGQPPRMASPVPAIIKKVSLADLSDLPQAQEVGDVPSAMPDTFPGGAPFRHSAGKVVNLSAEGNPAKALILVGEPEKEASSATASPSPVDWETLDRLTHWTIHTVEELGFERTRQLIGVYAQQGLLSEKAAKALLQIAATFRPALRDVNAEKTPAKKVTTPPPPPAPEPQPAKKNDDERNVILRVIRRLVLPSAEQEARRG